MEYKNTINSILKRLEKDFVIAEVGDIIETMDTMFLQKDFKNNIILEDTEMTIPLAASKETKKMLQEENSKILPLYKDLERGDILVVKEVGKNKVLVENISIKENYRKDFYIDKIDIIKKSFNVVKRKTIGLIKTLEAIEEQSEA